MTCAGIAQAAGGSPGLDGSNDAAIAEATFEEGKEALRRGDNERACALLEASQRLESALGTSLMLAHCYEALGKSASAWALFLEVEARATRAGDTPRAEIARVRAAALEPTLTRVTFELSVPDTRHARPEKLSVDDVEVDPAVWDVAFPLDPGEHVVVATAADHETWERTVEVAPSQQTLVIAVPALARVPVTRTEGLASTQPAPTRTVDAKPTDSLDGTSNRSTLAWASSGASVVALVAGGVLAASAQRDYDASLEHCRTPSLCSERGVELRKEAYAEANWATGAIAAGAVLGGLAAYLWLSEDAPTDRDSSRDGESDAFGLDLAPHDARVHWSGSF